MNLKENIRAIGTGMLIGFGTTSLWLAGKAYNKDKTMSGWCSYDRLCYNYGK